jgi:hypothetical protein
MISFPPFLSSVQFFQDFAVAFQKLEELGCKNLVTV